MQLAKPLWLDGVFLEPHHLQRQDLYHERFLARRLAAVAPLDWGVLDLAFDERALETGELAITRLDAILPDGTPIGVEGGTGDILPARRIEAPKVTDAPLDVYVGVAQASEELANVDLGADPMSAARYVRAQSTVTDLTSGGSERAVDWARHNLRILFGDERRDRFDVLRVASLVRASSGAFEFSDTFVAPVLRIGASALLENGFGRVLRAMTGKQRTLAKTRRHRSTVVEFQAGDAAKFWLLHTLNATLPAIAEIVDKRATSPRHAYDVLASFLGQLCTFDVEGDPLAIPRFNHLALGEVFGPMFAMTLDLLDRVVAERFVQIPLEAREGILVGELRDPALLQHAFFLAASGSYSEAQIREHVPKLTKISALHQIGAVMHSHVNGARLSVEHRPPGALPAKPGVVFFRVETAGDFWTQIVTTGSLAIHAPFDVGAMKLSLFAVDRATLQ